MKILLSNTNKKCKKAIVCIIPNCLQKRLPSTFKVICVLKIYRVLYTYIRNHKVMKVRSYLQLDCPATAYMQVVKTPTEICTMTFFLGLQSVQSPTLRKSLRWPKQGFKGPSSWAGRGLGRALGIAGGRKETESHRRGIQTHGKSLSSSAPPAPSSSHVPPEKIGGSGMVGRKGGGKTLSNSSIQPLSPPPSPPHLNFFFSVSSSSSSISGSARRFILGAGILCERTQNILPPPSYRRGHARHVSFSSV